jgi:hypothetical protein
MPVGEVGILADPKRDLDPTESHLRTDIRSFASVAQLVEHLIEDQGVSGSIPFRRTKFSSVGHRI